MLNQANIIARPTALLNWKIILGCLFLNQTADASEVAGMWPARRAGHERGNNLVAQRGSLDCVGVVGSEPGDKSRDGERENGSTDKQFHCGKPHSYLELITWMIPTKRSILAY